MRSEMAAVPGLICVLAALALALPPVLAQETQPGSSAWAQIHAVFSHPRCANCHVDDGRPRWSGASYGKPRPHAMNVMGGESGLGNVGMRCGTCHGKTNAPVAHGPPGAPDWHLAPAAMVWFGKSSAEICRQVKDPGRNGGRTLQQVAEHVRADALVAWGWAPGVGREPAPGSAEQTYRLLQEWISAGAPCPTVSP
jgi:hypothetical protein